LRATLFELAEPLERAGLFALAEVFELAALFDLAGLFDPLEALFAVAARPFELPLLFAVRPLELLAPLVLALARWREPVPARPCPWDFFPDAFSVPAFRRRACPVPWAISPSFRRGCTRPQEGLHLWRAAVHGRAEAR
jgi:hypothetical protein